MPESTTGNHLVCATLESLGVKHIFGLPGTQNLGFFEALRHSNIRTVLMCSELGAGFAANGYYRASGKPGVFTTIPGPGFTFALTALAEVLQASRRPLIYAGQGCSDAPADLISLAERFGAPVVMTRSARGVMPMDHLLALAFDFNAEGFIQFNELLDASDLILALGCKLGHNGSSGFQLRLAPEKLV